MLRADAATTVCSRLMDPDPTGQLLFRSVDILWNMLENGDQGQLAEQLNNLSCIRYCTAFICVGLVPLSQIRSSLPLACIYTQYKLKF